MLTRVSLLHVSPVARGVLEGGEVPLLAVEVWTRYVCLSRDLCGVKQGSWTDEAERKTRLAAKSVILLLK